MDPPSDDICYATQNRQLAVKQIAATPTWSSSSARRTPPTPFAWSRSRSRPAPRRRTGSTTRRDRRGLAGGRRHGRRHQRRLRAGRTGPGRPRLPRRAGASRGPRGAADRGVTGLRPAAGAAPRPAPGRGQRLRIHLSSPRLYGLKPSRADRLADLRHTARQRGRGAPPESQTWDVTQLAAPTACVGRGTRAASSVLTWMSVILLTLGMAFASVPFAAAKTGPASTPPARSGRPAIALTGVLTRPSLSGRTVRYAFVATNSGSTTLREVRVVPHEALIGFDCGRRSKAGSPQVRP